MRLKKRGLIRAGLEGEARGYWRCDAFTLTVTVSAMKGWLEPLLARIKGEPKAFVVPTIDVIDDKT